MSELSLAQQVLEAQKIENAEERIGAVEGLLFQGLSSIENMLGAIGSSLQSRLWAIDGALWNVSQSIISTQLVLSNEIRRNANMVLSGILGPIEDLLDLIRQFLEAIANGLTAIPNAIINAINGLASRIWSAFESLGKLLASGFEALGERLRELIEGAKSFLEGFINALLEQISKIVDFLTVTVPKAALEFAARLEDAGKMVWSLAEPVIKGLAALSTASPLDIIKMVMGLMRDLTRMRLEELIQSGGGERAGPGP